MGALGTGVQTCALPIYDVDPQLGVHHRAQCISDDIDLGCGFAHAVTASRFVARRARARLGPVARFQTARAPAPPATAAPRPNRAGVALSTPDRARANPPARSEEHTSELPSLMTISYAVFCLKKQNN